MSDEQTGPIMASWWTPTGWEWKALPDTFEVHVANAEQNWDASMRDAGYDPLLQTNTHVALFDLDIWRHTDRHLVVYIVEMGRFFVDGRNSIPFIADKLPELLRAMHFEQMTDAIKDLQTDTRAFIRHGHGTRTVSSWGQTKDEYEHEMETRRAKARS